MSLPAGCMKQIDTALFRAFHGHPRLKSAKWYGKIEWIEGEHILNLFHYHHLVLVYNVSTAKILHEWYEKPADKRGLNSAKLWLEWREQKYGRTWNPY